MRAPSVKPAAANSWFESTALSALMVGRNGGAVADVVGIGSAAFLRQVEGNWLSGEVNGLTGGLGERLPSVDLSHGDLA